MNGMQTSRNLTPGQIKLRPMQNLSIKKQIDTLKRKREKAGDKLAELKSASDEAWEDLKKGLESATDALGSALKSATAHFK
jgi:hypothetical protein